MSDLAVRLWELEKKSPLRLTAMTGEELTRLAVAFVGLLMASGGLGLWLTTEGFALALVLPILTLLVVLGVAQIWRKYRRRAMTLAFGTDSVWALVNGRRQWEIRYQELRKVTCHAGASWLTLEKGDGELTVSRAVWLTRAGTNRAVGRMVAANPGLEVSLLPESGGDDLGRWQRQRYFHAAPVPMRAGLTYRYACPMPAWRVGEAIFGFWTTCAFANAIRTGFVDVRFLVVPLLFAGAILLHALPAVPFVLAGGDRFEITPDGLLVTRRNKSWRVKRPRAVRLWGWCGNLDGNVLVFRRGWRWYFFDPRLIEAERVLASSPSDDSIFHR